MAESIQSRVVGFNDPHDEKNLRILLAAAQVDIASLRTKIIAMATKIDVLTAKLNADAGVTDTNYATDFASTLTPAALTFTQ